MTAFPHILNHGKFSCNLQAMVINIKDFIGVNSWITYSIQFVSANKNTSRADLITVTNPPTRFACRYPCNMMSSGTKKLES